jgi:DNA recombination protein RmuC
MPAADIALWTILCLAIVTAVACLILIRRPMLGNFDASGMTAAIQVLKSDLERIERTVRDNDARSFSSAEDRGRALRAEVADTIGRSTTTLITSVSAAGEAQKLQMEAFGTLLANSNKAVGDELRNSASQAADLQKIRLDTFAKQLSEGVKSLDDRMENLRRAVESKTNDLIQSLTTKLDTNQQMGIEQAKALREEVATTLKNVGDDLRMNATTASEKQKNQLDGFAAQLAEGLKTLDERMEALRNIVDQKTSDFTNTLTKRMDTTQETQIQQSKALREEISNSLKLVGDDLKTSAAAAANLQKNQFEGFAAQLTEGLKGLDLRMEALRQIVDQKIVTLTEGIGTRFETAQESAQTAGKALRDEVQTSLKLVSDDLRKNTETAVSTQKESLDQVAVDLRGLSDGVTQRLETFRMTTEAKLTEMRQDAGTAAKELREEVTSSLKKVGDELRENARQLATVQRAGLDTMAQRIMEIGQASQLSQEQLRQSVAEGLTTLRHENEAKLDQMRQVVDEKLQGTLEKRLGESFGLVTQQLKQVHEGLGDMQKLATGVGDLKRVLTNVKSRGTWGETQLAAILEDMLAPEQYARNVKTKDDSGELVEFCVKIPLLDEHQEHLLLPIDAKFPVEDYERLMEAADSGDPAGVEQAAQRLEARFRSCAKDIHTKYVSPPRTTEYGVLYVPSEGLYAEVIKRPGLASAITREFNVVIAGPTNLMAILNAVQAVSRSVTIQQKAGQIAALLLKVQSEFVKYGEAVHRAKRHAEGTVKAMEKLDTRQRAMGRALRNVKSIEDVAATAQLVAPTLDLDAEEAPENEDSPEDTVDDLLN